MNFKSVITLVISFWVASIYSSSSFVPFEVSAATEIKCERSGTVKVTCCQDHVINRSPANPAGTLVTYCTDCEATINDLELYTPGSEYLGYTNCSERYIQMSAEEPTIPVPPAAVARLQERAVLGEATTLPDGSVLEAQKANVTILPGGIIQETNTSSNDNSEQSDLASDKTENTTRTANDEGKGTEEQDESEPTKGQAREGTDDADDQENIDEELPLE